MIMKIILAVVAAGLALAFLAVPAVKLKEPALIVVILIGVAMMFYDLFESMREKDDQ